jgi:hypothetical protein
MRGEKASPMAGICEIPRMGEEERSVKVKLIKLFNF